jgi:hypothetical protein
VSTRILPVDEPEGAPYVTRFAGGRDRGVCYQVDDEEGRYITLTTRQAELVALAILLDTRARRRREEDES